MSYEKIYALPKINWTSYRDHALRSADVGWNLDSARRTCLF